MTKRILVVEDQEDNRRILRDLLTTVGYEIVEAEDGARGVTAAEAERPDLILMDIQLPIMDGYEATRRIKANPDLKAIPIIVVTSYALSGDEGKARCRRLRRLHHQALQSPRVVGQDQRTFALALAAEMEPMPSSLRGAERRSNPVRLAQASWIASLRSQ